MRKLIVGLMATSVLLLGSALVVEAAPVGLDVPAPDRSLIERVGCTRTDNCPIGKVRRRHESGKWSCVPCGYGDWDDHRHHYDDRDYDHRHHYDDRYYEPRRYPREY
jgi:hypothetical protein